MPEPTGNCVMFPFAGSILPIFPLLPEPTSANQSAPSGPLVMPIGWLPAATANSVITPAGVILPMKSATLSVNHRLPSGPLTIWFGRSPPGTGNSVSVPPVLMRPIARRSISVNHKLPSGPVTIPRGFAAGPALRWVESGRAGSDEDRRRRPPRDPRSSSGPLPDPWVTGPAATGAAQGGHGPFGRRRHSSTEPRTPRTRSASAPDRRRDPA